jgi:hypothetical protein
MANEVVYKITLPKDIKAPQTQIEQVEDVESGAEFLHVREHDGAICVWFKCVRGAAKIPRKFTVVGTGQPAPSSRYLGTAIRGERVAHVFVE